MSGEAKKSRFGVLKGVRETAQAPTEEQVPPLIVSAPSPPAPVTRDDNTQEPFSCTLSRGMKRRLKKASAEEARKQYLLVEQALEEYLNKHHPGVE